MSEQLREAATNLLGFIWETNFDEEVETGYEKAVVALRDALAAPSSEPPNEFDNPAVHRYIKEQLGVTGKPSEAEQWDQLLGARDEQMRLAHNYWNSIACRVDAQKEPEAWKGVEAIAQVLFTQRIPVAATSGLPSDYICPKCREAVPENCPCPYCELAALSARVAELVGKWPHDTFTSWLDGIDVEICKVDCRRCQLESAIGMPSKERGEK